MTSSGARRGDPGPGTAGSAETPATGGRAANGRRAPAPGPQPGEGRPAPELPAPAATLREPSIIAEPDAIEALVPEWRDLVVEADLPPFASPDWLLPWRRHYAVEAGAFLLAWHDGASLRALVPLVRRVRRLPPVDELGLWGGDGPALRGLVDVVVRPEDRDAVADSLATWLAGSAVRWSTLSLLRLPPGSPTYGAVARQATARGWGLASLTGVVRSDSYVLDLRTADGSEATILGPKARHNLRTEARRFERGGGRYEELSTPATVPGLVAAIRRLSLERWGPGERTFRPDPTAEPFLVDALESMAARGSLIAHVARDASGIRAGLATVVIGRRAVALLIGVSTDDDLRRFSLGKHLFAASIDAAVARGAETYDFLWVGGYKETFWGARPLRLESLIVGRGLVGRLLVRRAAARRRKPADHRPVGAS